MIYFFTGTDTARLREKLNAALGTGAVRITDAHSLADLEAALGSAGLFGGGGDVVLDSTLAHPELAPALLSRLSELADRSARYFILESAPDAATRKLLERHADRTEKIDLPKTKKQETIFGLANALQRGQKKDLWVGYQRELAAGKAPEAIHGVLFWAAKQQCLRAPNERARQIVAELAELPHEARRRGVDLEYALERFVLTAV